MLSLLFFTFLCGNITLISGFSVRVIIISCLSLCVLVYSEISTHFGHYFSFLKKCINSNKYFTFLQYNLEEGLWI